MSDHPHVVFDSASDKERMNAQIWLDEDGRVVVDREGIAGRKALPSELKEARDARAAAKKRRSRPYICTPPTNHHREIPGDGVARGA